MTEQKNETDYGKLVAQHLKSIKKVKTEKSLRSEIVSLAYALGKLSNCTNNPYYSMEYALKAAEATLESVPEQKTKFGTQEPLTEDEISAAQEPGEKLIFELQNEFGGQIQLCFTNLGVRIAYLSSLFENRGEGFAFVTDHMKEGFALVLSMGRHSVFGTDFKLWERFNQAVNDVKAHPFENSIEHGLSILEELADGGFPPAVGHLGMLYLKGENVGKDEKKGLELLKKAADMGDEIACFYMAILHKNGNHGVEINEKLSTDYMMSSAEKLYVPAIVMKKITTGKCTEPEVKMMVKFIIAEHHGEIFPDV